MNSDGELAGNTYYGITAGFNWKPFAWITLRPNLRYDWSDRIPFFELHREPYLEFLTSNQPMVVIHRRHPDVLEFRVTSQRSGRFAVNGNRHSCNSYVGYRRPRLDPA